MGVGVSSWPLARAVSMAGGLGVVSGTALDAVVARRLQDGDLDGSVRRALTHFPDQALVERVLQRYFRPHGRTPGRPYRPVPKLVVDQTPADQELAVVGNFVEVWLARAGHDGPIGINFLEKIQMATPAAAFGAMLAGVDVVLMGAGVPREIPQLLRDLAAGRPGSVGVDVVGRDTPYRVEVDPSAVLGVSLPILRRPEFIAVVSSEVLTAYLSRDDATRPSGFVIEGPGAGGHNAPPRGRMQLDGSGQPVYGPRDQANLEKVATVGLPFWLAGAYGSPTRLAQALELGAVGVQVGSAFALADESGLRADYRDQVRQGLRDGSLQVRTDPVASPTGFPFKTAVLTGTLTDDAIYAQRRKSCDLSYLRTPFVDAKGGIGYRCAAEPEHMYVRKGGAIEDTVGRKCLCNALTVDVGLGQTRADGYEEPGLVTLGSDLTGLAELARLHPDGWTAGQVMEWLAGERVSPRL